MKFIFTFFRSGSERRVSGFADARSYPQGPVDTLWKACGNDVEKDEKQFRNNFFSEISSKTFRVSEGRFRNGAEAFWGKTREALKYR